MGVVTFRSAQERADDELAGRIIDACGFEAGLRIRRLAMVSEPDRKAALERLADAIERRQGFGWYLEV